jgi:hypothetical protein
MRAAVAVTARSASLYAASVVQTDVHARARVSNTISRATFARITVSGRLQTRPVTASTEQNFAGHPDGVRNTSARAQSTAKSVPAVITSAVLSAAASSAPNALAIQRESELCQCLSDCRCDSTLCKCFAAHRACTAACHQSQSNTECTNVGTNRANPPVLRRVLIHFCGIRAGKRM